MNTSPTVSKSSLVKELEGGEGQWVTIHGNPVFIQSGQSVSEAFKAHAEKVEKQKQQVLPGVMAKASAAIKAGKGGKSVDPTYHAYGLYWEAKVAYESSKGTPGEKAAYEKLPTGEKATGKNNVGTEFPALFRSNSKRAFMNVNTP